MPNEVSDQPGHSPSVISGFHLGPKLTKQLQSEESIRLDGPFVGFVVLRFKNLYQDLKKVAANLPRPLIKKRFFVYVVFHANFTNKKPIL